LLAQVQKNRLRIVALGRTIMMHGEEERRIKSMDEFTPEDVVGIHLFSKIQIQDDSM